MPLIIMYAREHVCTRAGRGKRKWAVSTSRILPDEEEIVEGIDVRVLKGPFTKDAEWVLEPGAVASLICCRLSFAVASHLLSPLICCGLSSALVCHVLWRVSSAVVSHVPSCGACHDLSCVMSSVMLSATSSVISHLHLQSVMLSHLSCIMSSIMLSAALYPAPLLPRLVVGVGAVPRSARSPPACLPAV